MRHLLGILMVFSFFFTSAQINKDSLLIILQYESIDTSIQLEAIRQHYMVDDFSNTINTSANSSNNLLCFFLGRCNRK